MGVKIPAMALTHILEVKSPEFPDLRPDAECNFQPGKHALLEGFCFYI